ncbi:MAG: phosphatase PAP2 family protein [Planctomycetota bacterium]|nr:phosphatase PAP2 family protein [Planctomycetota bacterium]
MGSYLTQLGAAAWETEWLHAINCGLSSPWADAILLTLQRAIVGVVVMLVGIALLWFIDARRGRRVFLTALVGYGLCMGIAGLAWSAHHRLRPGRAAETVLSTSAEIATCAAHPEAVVVRGHVSRRSGMPSRHALSAGVFALTMLLACRFLGVIACVYALLVAVARVYAGVHWPSDVLAGLTVGALVAWFVWRALPWVLGLFGRRAWVAEPEAVPVGGEDRDSTPG